MPIYFGYSFDAWYLLTQVVTVLIVLGGALVATRQLKSVANASRFESLTKFQALTGDVEDLVWEVLNKFPVTADPRDLDELEGSGSDLLDKASRAVNFLNEMAQLIEERLVDPRVYFSIWHSQSLRLTYVLESYIAWREAKLHGRYGRRVLRLQRYAQRYNDVRAVHRYGSVDFTRGQVRYVVYKTPHSVSWRGLSFQFRIA